MSYVKTIENTDVYYETAGYGPKVLEASLLIPRVRSIVLVDTLKDLDQHPTIEQVEQMMFSTYRKDYKTAVETMLPKFLFTASKPAKVRDRLTKEFLASSADHSIEILAPLYRMDVRSFAKQVRVPVTTINSDVMPEKPEVFNELLDSALS